MLNIATLVGRVSKISKGFVTIATTRPYKNNEGIYETDFLICKLYDSFNTKYLKIGDTIGIKARIQNDEFNQMYLLAEKISFLSSNKREA